MKRNRHRRLTNVFLLFFALNLSTALAGPQAGFQQAYRLIKDADRAAWEGEVDPALESYRRALSLLDDLFSPRARPPGVYPRGAGVQKLMLSPETSTPPLPSGERGRG